MASHHHLTDFRSLKRKIDQKEHDLFKEKLGKPPLRVCLASRVTDSQSRQTSTKQWMDVRDRDQMNELRQDRNSGLQVYTIKQDRSWTTVNISRGDFEAFMGIHCIMPTFWDCMFTFGRKSSENEFEFPGFAKQRIGYRDPLRSIYELAYMARRVELHGRSVSEGGSPWSIRQTAVYHKIYPADNGRRSTFLLVAPSENAKSQFIEYLDQSIGLSPWSVHRIIYAESLSGWMDYMSGLEKHLEEQSNPVILTTVGSSKGNFSPLTNLHIDFDNRQALKVIDDQILELQIILPTMLDAIIGVQEQCQSTRPFWKLSEEEDDEVDAILGDFEQYVSKVTLLIKRAKLLKQQSLSISQLLSDFLSHEQAVALKELARETQIESRSMCHLAAKSTKDAAAVKTLTVITLIYLPTAIVASIFSTQFVHTDQSGKLGMADNAWLLAAISIPLTILTVLLWWLWVHFTGVVPIIDPQNPNVVTLKHQYTWSSVLSIDKKKQLGC